MENFDFGFEGLTPFKLEFFMEDLDNVETTVCAEGYGLVVHVCAPAALWTLII